MSSEQILKQIIQLFSTITSAKDITADSELMDDLDISSMDVLFLISSLEEEFNIKVPDTALRKVVTVGDVAEIIEKIVK